MEGDRVMSEVIGMSRYKDLDNENIVFFTPKQVEEMDIGLDMSQFSSSEMNTLFPFLADTLKEMVKETTIGEKNGDTIKLPVENGDCVAFICVEINGKLCKLQTEEWDVYNNLKGMPINVQVKVFQRLLSEGQITLDDLAAEDIDNSVYKKLVLNDIRGVQLCQEKIALIDKAVKEQKKDKEMTKRREKVINNL